MFLRLDQAKRVVVIGGGTAGWLSALEMRRMFAPNVEIVVIESEAMGIIGAGEGSIPNLNKALARYDIPIDEFMQETEATYKVGLSMEGWRTGEKDDHLYHLFSIQSGGVHLHEWVSNGYYPLMSVLMNQGMPIYECTDVYKLIKNKSSQAEVKQFLADCEARNKQDPIAYHFNAHKLAAYFKKIAISRGIIHKNAIVDDVIMASEQQVKAVKTRDGEVIELDFVIDSSGLSRLIIEKKMHSPWKSFSDGLLLDRAMPFLMPQKTEHPELVTRAVAMKSGWMWCIPAGGRIGAGYVYSSKHITKEEALKELEEYWGEKVEPINHLEFTPGHYEKVWIGNMMAVGLSSGFVEPLEATSIGQTITQLEYFSDTMTDCQGIVPSHIIEYFNSEMMRFWDGIADFLMMHYDVPRQDTPFWRDARSANFSDRYQGIRGALKLRSFRNDDLAPYRANSGLMWSLSSWNSIGIGLGVIPREATSAELVRLNKEGQHRVGEFLYNTRERLGLPHPKIEQKKPS